MSVTLDGIELDADQEIRWAIPSGPSAYLGSFEVSADQADALMATATIRGSVLKFALPGFDPVTIERLTILGPGPSSHPDLRTIHVADARWTWESKHIYRRWNVRGATGNFARVGDLNAPLAVKQLATDEVYRKWSLDGNTAMTLLAGLKDVLEELEGPGGFIDGLEVVGAGIAAGPNPGNEVLEELLLNDQGDGAVRRLLSVLGTMTISLTDSGIPIIRSRLDDGERALVGAPKLLSPGTRERGDAGVGPRVYGEPLWIVQDRRMERPAAYFVLFDREMEIRFDFPGDAESLETVSADDPPLRLSNVLPVPDETLLMPDGRTVVQGTWVPIADYITAKRGSWFPVASTDNPSDLTLEFVRQLYLCPGAFDGYCNPLVDEGGANQRAIASIMQHYRTTFQIDKVWRDRLAWWNPHMVSIVDPKRASFAESPVFTNYGVWITWRGARAEREDGDPVTKAFIANHFAAGAEGASIVDATIGELRRAPATVVPVDHDAGVFTLRFRLDGTGEQQQVIPSALDPDSQPSTDPSDRNIYAQWAALEELHEVSLILTVGMGAPNNNGVLHLIEVNPQALGTHLGRVDVGPCVGPPKFLRVDAAQGIAARFAWLDTSERLVKDLFKGAADPGAPEEVAELVPVLINGEDLYDAALAAATAHMAGLLDHVEGSLGTYMTSVQARGTASVEHRVSQGANGGAITTIHCPGDPPRPDFIALLPDAVRKRALAQIGAGPGGRGQA